MGLVNRLVRPDDLIDEAKNWARGTPAGTGTPSRAEEGLQRNPVESVRKPSQ
jgi:hypothetical protein